MKFLKVFFNKSSCCSAVISFNALEVVPRLVAVKGINWIRPTAPLPAAFSIDGLNVIPVSNAIAAMRKLGDMSRLLQILMTFSLNFTGILAPHASWMLEALTFTTAIRKGFYNICIWICTFFRAWALGLTIITHPSSFRNDGLQIYVAIYIYT